MEGERCTRANFVHVLIVQCVRQVTRTLVLVLNQPRPVTSKYIVIIRPYLSLLLVLIGRV